MQITKKQIEKVFTEWDREYREDPEKFQSGADRIKDETPEESGKLYANWFIDLFNNHPWKK